MSDIHVDRKRLKSAIRAIEPSIRAAKERMRSTPTPWPDGQNYARDLRALKATATILYAIAAHAHGRLHMRKCTKRHAHHGLPPLATFTIADQAKLIGERWREFRPDSEPA